MKLLLLENRKKVEKFLNYPLQVRQNKKAFSKEFKYWILKLILLEVLFLMGTKVNYSYEVKMKAIELRSSVVSLRGVQEQLVKKTQVE